MLVALLGVLAVGVWGAFAVFAANAPSTPTLTANPNVSPTNSGTETFTFSSSGAASYQCSLDASAFTATGCTSPKTVGTPTVLTDGSHSFQVKALDSKGNASSAASYSWVVDRTAPTMSAPVLAGSSPTNASSVSWTVTFSESVKNVVVGNFALAATNLTGASITGISGSGASYTVTASTGSLTNGSLNGSLGLNMANKGSGSTAITDLAGNASSTVTPLTGAVYTIDRVAPPAPSVGGGPSSPTNQTSATFTLSDSESGVSFLCNVDSGSYTACLANPTLSGLADGQHTLTAEAKDAAGNISGPSSTKSWTVDTTGPPKPTIVGPNNKSDSTSATFTFSDSESPVTYKCSIDGSAFTACPNPKTYFPVSPGTHEVDVEAVDALGNVGPFNGWKWTVNGLSGSGQPFKINYTATPTLYPTAPGVGISRLNLSLTNPNSVTIYITSLTVDPPTLTNITHTGPVACTASDFQVTQFSGTLPIALPPGTWTLTQLGYTTATQLPGIQMLDLAHSQDRCQGASYTLGFHGQAQS